MQVHGVSRAIAVRIHASLHAGRSEGEDGAG
jgi:hypothetical protein